LVCDQADNKADAALLGSYEKSTHFGKRVASFLEKHVEQ
jgi:hypothetical protein